VGTTGGGAAGGGIGAGEARNLKRVNPEVALLLCCASFACHNKFERIHSEQEPGRRKEKEGILELGSIRLGLSKNAQNITPLAGKREEHISPVALTRWVNVQCISETTAKGARSTVLKAE